MIRALQSEVSISELSPVPSGAFCLLATPTSCSSRPYRRAATSFSVARAPITASQRPFWVISGHQRVIWDVRFTLKSGHAQHRHRCPRCATSRHWCIELLRQACPWRRGHSARLLQTPRLATRRHFTLSSPATSDRPQAAGRGIITVYGIQRGANL